jgi:DNA-binding NarL/FixJ family response regulator
MEETAGIQQTHPHCRQTIGFKGTRPYFVLGEDLAKHLLFVNASCGQKQMAATCEDIVRDIREIKITPRDAEVLKLLVQGCSNKEIAGQLKISPRTVKQHLRTMFLRAGIRDGRKRVKLATAVFQKEQMESCNRANS